MIIKNKISIFFCFTDDSVEIFSFILLCLFYLAPYCGYAASYLIEFTLFGSQIWLCKWWLTKHKQG